MTEHIRQFDSLAEFVAAATAPNPYSGELDSTQRTDEYTSEWAGAESVEHAARLALDGSWSIADKVDALLAEVTPEIRSVTSLRPRRQYDVAGGAVNVGRFLTGDPRCMRRTTLARLPKHGRQITLMVNLSANCTVKPEDMLRRGTALVALADSLRLAGIGTTIYVTLRTVSQDGITSIVKVADSTQHVDRESLMYALANPSMFRRLQFAVMEHETPSIRKRIGVERGGYGSARDADSDVAEMLNADMVLNSSLRVPQADMVRWIKDQMNTLGVEVS